jgi:8-oxo-dGTP pyrophosphatase MutT (NUDIX family)
MGRAGVHRPLTVMKNSKKVLHGPRGSQKYRHSDGAARKLHALAAPDWSGLPILGSNTGRSTPLLQSGAFAFRRSRNGEIAVLVVKKPHSKNWGIPKGNAEPELSLAENAAKEAFEEAGVKGRIVPHAAGTYRAVKRIYGLKVVIEVYVHLLEVFETAKKWPEMDEREIRWCSPREAAVLLREPLLVELCNRLMLEDAI